MIGYIIAGLIIGAPVAFILWIICAVETPPDDTPYSRHGKDDDE